MPRMLPATVLIPLALLLSACGPNRAVQDLESQNATLESRIQSLEGELEEVQGQFASVEAELEAELGLTQERLLTAEAMRQGLLGDASALRVELARERIRVAEYERDLVGASVAGGALSDQLQTLQVQFDEKLLEVDMLVEERDELAVQLEVAGQQRQEAVDEVVRLETQLVTLEQDAAGARDELAALEGQVEATLSRLEETQGQFASVEAELEAELGLTQERLLTAEAMRQGLLGDASALRVELARERIRVAEYERDLAGAASLASDLTAERRARAEALSEASTLRIALARSRVQVASLEQGLEDLEVQVSEQSATLVALQTETERLGRDLAGAVDAGGTLSDRFQTLQVQFDEKLLEVDMLVEERDELAVQLEVAGRQRQEAVDEVARLEAQLVALEQDATGARVELAVLEGQVEATLGRLEEVQAELTAAQAAVESSEVVSQNLTDSVNQADQALTQLGAERDALLGQVATLQGEVAAAIAQAAGFETSLAQVSEERDTLLLQLDRLENRNASLNERLEGTASELETAQSLASELTSQYEVLLRESAQLDQLSDSQRQQLESTREALEVAQNEVARITGARGIYTVQPLDSLSSIAGFFYRDGFRWSDIAAANSFLIGDNPDLIYPGMVLIVPE